MRTSPAVTLRTLLALVVPGVCAGMLLMMSSDAFAQDRPVRLMVGFAPGGVADAAARALADRLRGRLTPTVLVENRPGAGGRLAVEQVKVADPDGTTLLVTPNPMITIYPHAYRKLSYAPERDLAPVAMLGAYPVVLAVGPAVPGEVRTLDGLVSWLKANPARASFGTSAAGSTLHFVGVGFARAAGVDLAHVAYKGGGPAVQDLLGGQIPFVVATPAAVRGQLSGGRVRALAVSGEVRSPTFPDVPTFREAGVPGLEMQDWIGVFAPAKTPTDRIARLADAIGEALREPELREAFAKLLVDPRPLRTEEFAVAIRAETAAWVSIVRASGFVGDE